MFYALFFMFAFLFPSLDATNPNHRATRLATVLNTRASAPTHYSFLQRLPTLLSASLRTPFVQKVSRKLSLISPLVVFGSAYIAQQRRTLQTYAQDEGTKWRKPKWATQNDLPNGVPPELERLVEFIKNPKKFTYLGATLPTGAILYGPPGTGKTSIARAIAQSTERKFIYTAGSELSAHLYGLGADRVREMFERARENGPVIIFIDEIDLIGTNRSDNRGYGEQITQLLHELDGFAQDKDRSIFVIGATNRLEVLDPALTRSKRLNPHILIPLPDLQGRKDIIDHYMDKIIYDGKAITTILAYKTEGFSGADLQALINEAAILAGFDNEKAVNEHHVFKALESSEFEKITSCQKGKS